jgi:DNA-binding MarR family transcriptional regulator
MNNSVVKKLHQFVFRLDKVADKMLKKELGISYRRAVFLVTLLDEGAMSQHELATALGYSDPAVSSLLIELIKSKYVTAIDDPNHGRKRIVSLTDDGTVLAQKLATYLDGSFNRLARFAGIDERAYGDANDRLLKTLINYEQRKLDNMDVKPNL